jgi:hypothetical protein
LRQAERQAKGQTRGKRGATIKNEKNVKNDKKGNTSGKTISLNHIINDLILSQELIVKTSKLQRMMKKLEIAHQIEQQTSNKNTVITITNWHTYQACEQQSEHQAGTKRASSGHKNKGNKLRYLPERCANH